MVATWGVLIALEGLAVANPQGVSVKLEPAVAIPLSAPQSQIYDVGGGQSVKVLFGLTSYLDIGPSASVLVLPAANDGAESGVAWGLGGGLRLKQARDAEPYASVSPWLDGSALYVRTGGLDRAAFDVAAGVAFPLGEPRALWIGPFVRYMQTIQLAREGYDNRDAKILLVGVSFEVSPGRSRKRVAPDPVVTPEPASVAPEAAAPCPDRDHDGMADYVDRCPDVAGSIESAGCPGYEKVVVKADKLELKEKLYFGWDQAKLEDASFPVLDEVVKALKDNPGFRVQIEGHADSSGGDDHNQTLSEQRAQVVLSYLTSHGISNDRLISKGFSSSVPLDTNKTAAGRENNRRVEFVVNFIIIKTDGAQ
jgi:outer membrane protein OmpA-like peptidoglycan-associated protein